MKRHVNIQLFLMYDLRDARLGASVAKYIPHDSYYTVTLNTFLSMEDTQKEAENSFITILFLQAFFPLLIHNLHLSLSSLPPPEFTRSEMDLSAPLSEASDDALSLRSRSVPGFNEAVSGARLSPAS